MTKFNKLKTLLSMLNSLNGYESLPDFDDTHYMSNPKIGDIQFKLYILTIQVIDNNISDEDLEREIKKLKKEIDDNLSFDEIEFVKKDFQKTMNLRRKCI